MLQSLIIMVSLVGVVSAGAAVVSTDNNVAIIAGLLGSGASGLSAFGLFNVQVVSSGTVVTVGSQPGLSLMMATVAFVSAIPALTGPLNIVGETRDRGGID